MIERIDPDLSAEEFFSRYVSKRRPVIITGLIDDSSFKGRKWSDLSYLSKKAGSVEVMVEPIHPAANQYGTDVERVSTTFGDFLASLRSDKGPHPYLTTQYSEEEPDAETFFPPPTNALRDDFPVVPRIMGNLFLQQVNLWLGKSKDGSSSGLHHDFHDNLYCLLRGRKRFVLFPPSEVKNLYPYGTLDALHPNGLISYADVPVRADGLSKRAACRARVRALEQKMDALRARTKGKGKGKSQSKELRALMDAHDEALDELAELALDEHDGDDEVDDFDALMAGLDDVSAELAAGPSGGKGGTGAGEEQDWPDWHGIGHSDDENDESGEDDDDDSSEEEEGLSDGSAEPSEPSSFSRIPTAHVHQFFDIPTTAALPPDFSPSEFPRLRKAAAPHVIELSAGEMLYLPASWWHEVTSTSASDAPREQRQASHGDSNVHMAFNYWFYPPDALDDFDAPYEDALVWDYLRSKARQDPQVEKVASEKVKTGKRARKEGDSEVAKKARR